MAKILIVQDSKSIGIMMKSLLESENFIVSMAETGEDAVKKIQEEDFGLILLDYGLPGMNGDQVCRILKKDEACRSSSETPIDRQQAAERLPLEIQGLLVDEISLESAESGILAGDLVVAVGGGGYAGLARVYRSHQKSKE